MRTAWLLSLALLTVPASASAAVEAVPTFHAIGLSWSGSGGSATVVCDVRYRVAGQSAWTQGYPLWFDARAVGGRTAGEYRGSLVGLTPGTAYEIELSLRGQTATATATATTWS